MRCKKNKMKNKNRVEIIEKICKENNIEIEWRKSSVNSGLAYIDKRKIIIPTPKSDRKIITCFHEIAHIIQGRISPRYFEEYKAVKMSFEFMKEYNFKLTRKIKKNQKWYVALCLQKAIHRKLNFENVPKEIIKFIQKDYPNTSKGIIKWL